MAADHTFIKVEVPPGFLPQSEPVKEDDRISLEDIRIKPVTKDDLPAVVRPEPHPSYSRLSRLSRNNTPLTL